MNGILYYGGFDNFSVSSNKSNKQEYYHEQGRRLAFAELFINYPEVFKIIERDNVILFHGTKSAALPSILKYGIKSVDEAAKEGIEITTGEEWTRFYGKREFISITDNLRSAMSYAQLNPDESEFGVLIGISIDYLDKLETLAITSDVPEIGIIGNIPVEYINMIVVPEDKVEFVKKLVGDKKIEVTSMDMDRSFCKYASQLLDQIQDPKDKKRSSRARKIYRYSKKDVEKLATGRRLTNLLGEQSETKDEIKNGGEDYGHENR